MRALAHIAPAPERFAPLPLAAYAVIDARPIFSSERKPIEPAEVSATSGPATLAKAVLVEVIMDTRNRLALVKTATSPLAKSFAVGATIDGWRVQEIDADKVILRSGAAQEEIRLNADQPAAADAQTVPAPAAQATAGAQEQAPEAPQPPVKPVAQAAVSHGDTARSLYKPVIDDSGPHAFPTSPNLQGAHD